MSKEKLNIAKENIDGSKNDNALEESANATNENQKSDDAIAKCVDTCKSTEEVQQDSCSKYHDRVRQSSWN